MKQTIKKNIVIIFLFIVLVPFNILAYTVEKNEGVGIENRFVVGPAKIESEVLPGETKEIVITVENRMGRTQAFEITFEDFVASSNEGETIELLGDEISNTTLKNFLFVPENRFTLDHGDRVNIPVTISLRADTPPGGKFGTVVISGIQEKTSLEVKERAYTGTTVIGQVATLLFVTVPGETVSKGQLISFTTKNNRHIFTEEVVPVRITYENTGNVHLNPYGGITVKNMFGKVVTRIPIDPWFTLPESVRTRDVVISAGGMFGKYTASLELNRGYEDIVDEKSFTFFVISPESIFLICIFLIAVIWGIRELFKRKNNSFITK